MKKKFVLTLSISLAILAVVAVLTITHTYSVADKLLMEKVSALADDPTSDWLVEEGIICVKIAGNEASSTVMGPKCTKAGCTTVYSQTCQSGSSTCNTVTCLNN